MVILLWSVFSSKRKLHERRLRTWLVHTWRLCLLSWAYYSFLKQCLAVEIKALAWPLPESKTAELAIIWRLRLGLALTQTLLYMERTAWNARLLYVTHNDYLCDTLLAGKAFMILDLFTTWRQLIEVPGQSVIGECSEVPGRRACVVSCALLHLA